MRRYALAQVGRRPIVERLAEVAAEAHVTVGVEGDGRHWEMERVLVMHVCPIGARQVLKRNFPSLS